MITNIYDQYDLIADSHCALSRALEYAPEGADEETVMLLDAAADQLRLAEDVFREGFPRGAKFYVQRAVAILRTVSTEKAAQIFAGWVN